MGKPRKLGGFTVSNPGTFRITFHVSHPSSSASEIEGVFKLPVKFSQSVGMQRATNSGKILEGLYKRTNVNFSLHEKPLSFDDFDVAEVINEQLKSLNEDYLNKIYKTGGTNHFILGIFSEDNVMLDIDIDLIQYLSCLKIGVKLDFYGGSD